MKSLCLVLLLAAACGDNSEACGPGTSDVGGECTPNVGMICGDGTLFDPASGACLPDPGLCGSGTVLINGTCQDPTAGLSVDLEEGPEPNGFEPGAAFAGDIALKPIGDPKGFVVHGCIKPNADVADFDDFRITVTAPTLIDVTADGVHGLAAGFVALGDDPAIATWQRFGLNTMTDMSHRELFLPKAGTYELVMADTRSLLGIVDGSGVLVPAGNADGTSCYYVTLNQEAIPTPIHLAVPVGTNDVISNKVLFYSGTLPSGVIDLQESIASPYALPAFAVLISDQLRVLDDRGEVAFAGVKDTDTDLIAVDTVYNYAFTPPNFEVSFAAATTAQALPTTNTSVTTTSKTQVGTLFITTNQFYFDAPSDEATLGMNLASTKTVQGVVWDSDLHVVSRFGGFTPVQTFTSYVGLWRAPKAGRYYLALIDPSDGAGTSFTITSTVTQLVPAAVAIDTPLTAQTPNPFGSNPYSLDLTGEDWDLFAATNTAVAMYDPATAFGRLDPLVASTGPLASDPAPLVSFDGSSTGYVVHGLDGLLIKANPHGTFDLDFTTRVATDLAFMTNSYNDTAPANDAHRYFIAGAPGSTVQISVTAGILEILNADETVAAASNPYTIPAAGFVAFSVRGPGGAAVSYTLDIVATRPFYTYQTTSTEFVDACFGGVSIPVDTGVSELQTTPAGFTFYSAFDSLYAISANGYLSFHTDDDGTATPHAIPDHVGAANIAPMWQPQNNVTVCRRRIGSKTTIQWSGDGAQFQAILDAADSSIEYVYGPNLGGGGISGVQSLTGSQATSIAPFGAPGTSVKLTHP